MNRNICKSVVLLCLAVFFNSKAFNPPQNLVVDHQYVMPDNYYTPHWKPPKPSNNGEKLVEYKIYVNDKFCFTSIDTIHQTNAHELFDILNDWPVDFTFYVTAVYENPAGESVPSNKVTKGIAVNISDSNPQPKTSSQPFLLKDKTLVLPEGLSIDELKLYSSSGELVDVIKLDNIKVFSLERYGSCVYYCHFTTDEGVENRKILIKR
jgi:hypothetical protein